MKEQCLTWNDEGGNAFCDACHVPIDFTVLAQHIHQKNHKAKVIAATARKNKQHFVTELIDKYQDTHSLHGRTLDPAVKRLRFRACRALYASNTSVDGSDPIIELLEEESNMKIGRADSLALYGDMIFAGELHSIGSLNAHCFKECGFTGDGTPNGAEWEGFALRLVTYEFKIIEPLVRAAALTKGPNAALLVLSWEDSVVRRCNRAFADFRTGMLDRAATNGAACRLMGQRNASFKVFKAKCSSHTIVKVGEKFTFAEGAAGASTTPP
jgi:hypothetical protein